MDTLQTSVVFYRGMAPVRFWLKSHYGHVAFRYNNTIIEAISSGVREREFGSHDVDRYARQIAVSMVRPETAVAYGVKQLKKPYDWGAIRQDFLAPIFPYLRLTDIQEDSWDCSRIVQGILAAGGHPTIITHYPVTPQDLYLALTAAHPYGFPQPRLPVFSTQ